MLRAKSQLNSLCMGFCNENTHFILNKNKLAVLLSNDAYLSRKQIVYDDLVFELLIKREKYGKICIQLNKTFMPKELQSLTYTVNMNLVELDIHYNIAGDVGLKDDTLCEWNEDSLNIDAIRDKERIEIVCNLKIDKSIHFTFLRLGLGCR